MASDSSRLCSKLEDEELKELLKLHVKTSPLSQVSLYRNADWLDICDSLVDFFVAVAAKQTRLNKIQLTRMLLRLYKGDKKEMNEIAGKIALSYSTALSMRKNVTSGKKLPSNVYKIIAAFKDGKDEKEIVDNDSEDAHSAPPIDTTPIKTNPSADAAEKLLRAARERFQITSPPSKKIDITESPTLITDSPLQANILYAKQHPTSEQTCSGIQGPEHMRSGIYKSIIYLYI